MTIIPKAVKVKGGRKEQPTARKMQLTGSASMAVAVLEAGSKPLSRTPSVEDAGEPTGSTLSPSCTVTRSLTRLQGPARFIQVK